MNYKYSARDSAGRLERGKIAADSLDDFYAKMQEKKLFCMQVEEIKNEAASRRTYRMKMRDLSIFCRQLSTMLSSGLTLVSALDILYSKCSERKQKQVLLSLYEGIQKGLSLYEAMLGQRDAFPVLLMNMVQAGEVSGTIDTVMAKMADHYERQNKLLGKIRTSLAYPVMLLVITFAVVILLFVFVLPQFFVMFENNADIPNITKVIMAVSDFLVNRWYAVLLGVLLVVFALSLLFKTEKVKYGWDWLKLNFPAISKLTSTIYISFFTNTMSILYSSGISMLDSIEVSAEVLNNRCLKAKFAAVLESVGKGEMMSASIEREKIFDSMVTSMMYVGEESGRLDTVLGKLSAYYSDEAEQAIAKLMTLFEPVMMVVIGIVIGIVIAAVMLPMYNMYSGVL